MELNNPVEAQSLRKLTYKSLKRSLDFFGAPGNKNNVFVSSDPESKKIRMSHKLQHARYESQVLPKICKLQHALYESQVLPKICTTTTLVPHVPPNLEPTRKYNNFSTTIVVAAAADMMSSLSNKSRHPLWKTYRVISNHLGSVRCVAFDPSNQWFCTGSADRTIKIWDLASGRLNHTLTGHIGQVRSLAVSDRHTYMFSAGDDKQVKCWDLEQNKVIRSFHGHLSGVYCLALHPTIDVIFTGGRDSVCRVWDVRTKVQIHALSGHDNTVCSVFARSMDPQVVTGSHDTTIKLWDLRYGKSMATLTHHKKSVRALVQHPVENAFASAAADSIKKFNLPRGKFMHNMVSEHKKTIVNAVAVNRDGVMVSGGDDGSLLFSDWKTGKNYQKLETIAQPGSLDCEAAIYAASFDVTGSRLVTCEADKTIKMWKQEDII